MNDFHILAASIGGIIVLFSFLEKKIEQAPLSEPLLAMALGVLFGPVFLKLIDPAQWPNESFALHVTCEATIAMALMATALRLPTDYVQKHIRTLGVLLLFVMILMIAFSAFTFWGLLCIPFLSALLLGAIIAPTDPVVATSVVSGPVSEKFLPARIRNTISMESGANDGLGMPFVMLPILLITKPTGSAWGEWLFEIVLWENLGAIVIGAAAGICTGKMIIYINEKRDLSSKAFLSFSIALAFFVLAGVELLGANGVIAVFAAGLGVNHLMDEKHEFKVEKVQDMIERLFTIPVFFIFGLMVPWNDWFALGWQALLLPIIILIVRRLPAIFLSRPGIKTLHYKADFWFTGWFGPIGVAALYYGLLAHEQIGDPLFWTWPSLIVFYSTMVHGITSGPAIKWYSQRIGRVKKSL